MCHAVTEDAGFAHAPAQPPTTPFTGTPIPWPPKPTKNFTVTLETREDWGWVCPLLTGQCNHRPFARTPDVEQDRSLGLSVALNAGNWAGAGAVHRAISNEPFQPVTLMRAAGAGFTVMCGRRGAHGGPARPLTCIHSHFRRGRYAREGASVDFPTGGGVTPAGAQGEPGGARPLLACAASTGPLPGSQPTI